MKYVHLDTFSSYSLLSSTIKINELINKAKKQGCEYVALADRNNMYGAIDFYKKATANNIKPIIGLNIEVDDFRVIAYAKNFKGYQLLMKISSQISVSNFDKNLLDNNNLIVIGDDYEYQYEDVIAGPVRYLEEKNFRSYEIVKAIKKSEKVDLEKITNENKYFTDFSNYNEFQFKNIEKIVNSVDLKIEFGKAVLPKFETPNNESAKDYLLKLSIEGLKQRFGPKGKQVYVDRLKEELRVITDMGYCDYFLIVWDFVKFAKENKIAVGPGRGSAAGSLVSYCLKITDVDPIKYGLLFERFLNKDRVSMPDIDIDFQDTRREEVINYITTKYGNSHAALIITFQTMAAKSSIRDVARVIGVDLKDADKISKAISSFPGTTLNDAYKTKKFKTIIDSKNSFQNLYSIARDIEGLPKNYSTHAAGIVLADSDLNNYVPTQPSYGKYLMSQYSMKHLEELGLLKIDILGLKNMNTISEILTLIKNRHGKDIDLSTIDFEDQKTLGLLKKGLTTGIFQLESPGMKGVLKRMVANSLEDIVSSSSLFRPGPQDNIPSYIARKHGREEIEYINDDLRDILEPTYGIIVYQEQIMQIAQVYAGFTLPQADILRRAMGKKIASELDAMKNTFLEGALKCGRDKTEANKVYDLIFKFADYGFNRSHAVAYSIIGYQMLYLKAHYTLEFMSCLLSSHSGNADKTNAYIRECKEFGLKVTVPSINHSTTSFKISDNNLLYPLTAIKQVGSAAYREIARIRQEDGPFKDIYDFFGRVQLARVSTAVITALIKAGAFDEFKISRSTLLKSQDDLMIWSKASIIKTDGVKSYDPDIMPRVALSEFADTEDMLSKLESESLGFNLVHGKNKIKPESGTISVSELIGLEHKATALISGRLKFIRPITTSWGQNMAFGSVTDSEASIDIMVSPSAWNEYESVLKPGTKLVIEGELSKTKKYNLRLKK